MITYAHYIDEDINYSHKLDEYPQANNFSLHAHDTDEIYYFISGEGTYFVEGNYYPLSPGSILIMRANEVHRFSLTGTSPYERISLHFSPSISSCVDPHGILKKPFYERVLGSKNLYSGNITNNRYILSCFKRMALPNLTECEKRVSTLSNIAPIFWELYTAYSAISASKEPTPIRDPIADIIDYINDNLTTNLSLYDITERFYFSKSHINRMFQSAVGSTVWQYILTKRLVMAKQMIKNGIPATTASTSCGFHDYSAFFRAYKKHFGVNPSNDKILE